MEFMQYKKPNKVDLQLVTLQINWHRSLRGIWHTLSGHG